MPNGFAAPLGMLTIAEMAAIYGVSIRTLRFYEDRGLLEPRRVGLARFYAPKDRIRLELIIKGKRLGFTLTEIERQIGETATASLDVVDGLTKDELIRLTEQLVEKREKVQAAIDELTAALASKEDGETG